MSVRGFVLAGAIALIASSAHAQNTADSLTSVCSGVLAETAGGVSGNHAKLCACLVRETPAQLTPAEMSAYAESAQANRAPPDSVTQKIAAIATKCLAEAQ